MPVTIDELTIADDPERWSALGFDVQGEDLTIGTVRLRLCGRSESTSAQGAITGWSLRGLESAELDGLPTAVSERAAQPPAGPHPNGVVAIDHVVAISPAFERSVEAFQAAGLDLRRIREEPTPTGAPRQAFFRLGAEILELVAEPEQVSEAKGGSERPVRFWGLALLVENLAATLESMAPHTGTPRPAVQPGRTIVTVARSAGLAIPIALMTPKQRGEHDG